MGATVGAGRPGRRSRGQAVGVVAATAALLALGGCAGMDGSPGEGSAPDGDGTEGGFGLPVVPEEGVPGESVPLTGVLAVEENGCFSFVTADGVHHWAIWPRGAEDDGAQVILGDGTVVTEGTALEGTGQLLPIADAIPEFSNTDSYFGSFGRFCEAEDADVAVLEDVGIPEAG